MNTNPSPELQGGGEDHGADFERGRSLFGWKPRLALIAVAAFLVICALGVYRDWYFLSGFNVSYLEYLTLTGFFAGFVKFFMTVLDRGFIGPFIFTAIVLSVIILVVHYLKLVIRVLRLYSSLGRPLAPARDAIREVLADQFAAERPFFARFVSQLARPLVLGPVLIVAALLAINASALEKQREIRKLATEVRAAATSGGVTRASRRSSQPLVSVQLREPAATFTNLIPLTGDQSHRFFFDPLTEQAVILRSTNIAGLVPTGLADVNQTRLAADAPSAASETAEEATAPPETAALPVTEARAEAQRDMSESAAPGVESSDMPGNLSVATTADDPLASSDVEPVVAEPVEMAQATTSPPASTLPLQEQAVEPAAGPGTTTAVSDQNVPKTTGAPDVRVAGTTAAGALPTATVSDQPSAGVDEDLSATVPEIGEYEAQFSKSRATVAELKAYMEQFEQGVADMAQFVEELDATLTKLDEAFVEVVKVAVTEPPVVEDAGPGTTAINYSDCADLFGDHPIQFGIDDTSLSLEAVGLLFQARHDLTAPRSLESADWIVIEGRSDSSGDPVHNQRLSEERAETVRKFLVDELGVADEFLQVVALGGTGPGERLVRIYDCRQRQGEAPVVAEIQPAAAPAMSQSEAAPTTSQTEVQLLSTPAAAAASEQEILADLDPELVAIAAELHPRRDRRGLLLTVPGDSLFETNSTSIKPTAYPLLAKVAEVLDRERNSNALIIGHADAFGDASYNRQLSRRRAAQVRDFLVDNFEIDAARLNVEGRGEDDPIASNDTRAGRRANRRIEVLLLN